MKTLLLRLTVVTGLIVFLTAQQTSAFTQNDFHCAQQGDYGGTCFYDPTATACGASTGPAAPTGGPVSATAVEAANAKIILGIAKTDGLGQDAGLIGLMTAIDESTLSDLANSTVPLSESNPQKQGDGNNGSSLGVFQQQIIDAWSTISSDPNNTAAVNQLMTPAYDAEAFFGSPSGSHAPSALSKGLQNISGWQSMQPWVAAQAVQHSGTPDGSNYERYVSQAQSLLGQYWASAPAIPLPVPISGGPSGGPSNGSPSSCPSSASCASPGTPPVVGTSQVGQNVACLAQQELQLWQSGTLKPGTNAYSKYSNGRNEEWCADFASWIYSQAGDPFGPAGSNGPSWDISLVANLQVPPQNSSQFTYHSVASGYTPQPGDIAIHGGAHVNIVVSVSGTTITLIGGDQGGHNFTDNIVSEYSITNPSSDIPALTGYISPH